MILAAAREVLLEAGPSLKEIASGRVFAVELPPGEAAAMPRRAAVVIAHHLVVPVGRMELSANDYRRPTPTQLRFHDH